MISYSDIQKGAVFIRIIEDKYKNPVEMKIVILISAATWAQYKLNSFHPETCSKDILCDVLNKLNYTLSAIPQIP